MIFIRSRNKMNSTSKHYFSLSYAYLPQFCRFWMSCKHRWRQPSVRNNFGVTCKRHGPLVSIAGQLVRAACRHHGIIISYAGPATSNAVAEDHPSSSCSEREPNEESRPLSQPAHSDRASTSPNTRTQLVLPGQCEQAPTNDDSPCTSLLPPLFLFHMYSRRQADSGSDSLGLHSPQEDWKLHQQKSIWRWTSSCMWCVLHTHTTQLWVSVQRVNFKCPGDNLIPIPSWEWGQWIACGLPHSQSLSPPQCLAHTIDNSSFSMETGNQTLFANRGHNQYS